MANKEKYLSPEAEPLYYLTSIALPLSGEEEFTSGFGGVELPDDEFTT